MPNVNSQTIFNREKQNKKPAIKTHHMPLFATFFTDPDLYFSDLQKDEKVVLFLRADFITNVPWIFFTLLGILLPFIFFFLLSIMNLPDVLISSKFIVILVIFYYLLIFGYAFGSFINWYYNIGLVTTKRVIDLDVAYITYRNLAATQITMVKNVEYTQAGFLHAFFDYGTVLVQTDVIRENIEFEHVPNPGKVAHIVLELRGSLSND